MTESSAWCKERIQRRLMIDGGVHGLHNKAFKMMAEERTPRTASPGSCMRSCLIIASDAMNAWPHCSLPIPTALGTDAQAMR